MKEFSNRMKIISQSYIKIFSVSTKGSGLGYWYPYRLEKYGNTSKGSREECLEYLFDSGIGNNDITNKDLIEKAEELNPSYMIPKDYLHKQKETTESIKEFLHHYHESSYNGKILVPLQPPYDQHLKQLENKVGNFSHYALGGIAEKKPEEQLAEIKRFRDKAGPHVYAHGLGLGASLKLIKEFRERPSLLDSLDLSTPEAVAKNNKVFDKTMHQKSFGLPEGEHCSNVRAMFVSSMLIQLNYLLSPLCDDEVVKKNEGQQNLETLIKREI